MSLKTYKIWTNDGLIEKEDAQNMSHIDPQSAVEEFVETYDKNNTMYFANYYSVTRNIPLIIFCEDTTASDVSLSSVTKWSLSVETVPQYFATEVK